MSVVAEIPAVSTLVEDRQAPLHPYVRKLVSKVLTQIIETEGYNSDVWTASQNLVFSESMLIFCLKVWLRRIAEWKYDSPIDCLCISATGKRRPKSGCQQ